MPARRRHVAVLAASLALAVPGAAQAATVKVYFIRGEQLAPVVRTVPVGAAPATFALTQLLSGPNVLEQRLNVRSQLLPGTTLRGVAVRGGVAEATFSPRFTEAGGTDTLLARITQVVKTLRGVRGVRSVRIAVANADGTTQPVQGGAFDGGDLAPGGPGPPGPVQPRGDLTPGSPAGPATVQRRLVQLGYLPPAAVSGENDYRTQQAVMAFQAWQGIGRDGVVGPVTLRALRTATAPVPQAGGPGRRVEVHRARGVALLVDGDRLVRAVHVSTGAPGTETPAGTFSVYRKALRDWSYPFQVWLPYASYFTGGIAFHEYPDVPPEPASHGCVRVSAPEAPFVYQFARIGTPVTVY